MKPGGAEAAALSLAEKAAAAPWRSALAALAVLLPALVWLYRDTAGAMVAIWSRSDTFAHAFTVPPIVAWLVWRQRHAMAARAPRPAAWLLVPIGAVGLTWLLGDLAAANAVAQLAFTALLVLAFVAVAGTRAARVVAFPLCFLFFAVPVGEFLMPQLMVWTADFTVQALRLSGIPVYREGLQFVIPSGNWSVVEACSGVRYLIASFMVGTLFAYLNYRSTWRRLAFVAVAIVVPIVANWVRAYGIVMLGHLSNNQLAAGADHLLYGWLFFGVVIVLMFAVGARWAEADVPSATGDATTPLLPRSAQPAPARPVRRVGRMAWAVGCATFVVAALPPAALRMIETADAGTPPALAAPAELPGGWRQLADGAVGWLKPAFDKPAAAVDVRYRHGTDVGDANADGDVGIYIGYYRQQSYGNKLVSSQNQVVRSKDPVWAKLSEGSQVVSGTNARVADLETTAWRTTLLRGSARRADEPPPPERLLVWQLYWVNGRFVASDAQAKLWTALDRLLGRGDDAAVILLSTPHAPTEAGGRDAEKRLNAFAGDNLPSIDALLRRTRDAARAGAAASTRSEARGKAP